MLLSPVELRAVMTGVVLIVLALAAREDLLRQRIPNSLNAIALTLGVGTASMAGGWSGFADSIGGALVGCAALLPFYVLHGMGAGDVKLMAAAGAFLGPGGALFSAAAALVAGLILALLIVGWRLVEPRPFLEAARGRAEATVGRTAVIAAVRKERFPYAVAIGAGVVANLWRQGSLRELSLALGIG
jgi:prepilin peptidase CpaA